MKSLRRNHEKPGDRPLPDDPGNPSIDFHIEKRSNATHQSTTDPEFHRRSLSRSRAWNPFFTREAALTMRDLTCHARAAREGAHENS